MCRHSPNRTSACSGGACPAFSTEFCGRLTWNGPTFHRFAGLLVSRRPLTLRALSGAVVGVALGLAGVVMMPAASDEGGFLTGLGFQGAGWALPLAIPPLGALVAFAATWAAARRQMREVS